MLIDPKWTFILGCLVTIELAIGKGTISLTNALPTTWIPVVTAWSDILAFIGSTLMTGMAAFASGRPGFAATMTATPAALEVAKKAVVFLAIGTFLAMMCSPAFAQQSRIQELAQRNDPNKPGGLTPLSPLASGIKSPDELIDKLQEINLADFKFAKAKAKAAGNKVTEPCWSAWVDLLEKRQAPMKDDAGNVLTEPDPHIFSSLEDASQLLQALQVGGPIQTGCAALADAAKKSVAQIIGAIVGGGKLGGLLPFPIP